MATVARTHLPFEAITATLARSKSKPYARASSSNVSAPRQHYLQADRPWNRFSKATSLSWFDRVSILEKGVDVITCGIEKNGITLLNRILAKVMGGRFEWFPANPSTVGLSLEAFKDRLGDASNSWRKLVVYRDPMERFLSAYRSKCLLADGDRDGRMHCHNLFRLNDSQISVLNVASRLPQYGHHNPHWATQTYFFQREIYYRERLRAYVCYTGRFVVGRGRECSDGCGLHSFEVCGLPSSLALGVGALVCPGRGRASAPRLRVVPRVQVAHCPADLLYADTRRPSSGWRGPSATESVHASLRPPLRPTGDSVPIGFPITGRRP